MDFRGNWRCPGNLFIPSIYQSWNSHFYPQILTNQNICTRIAACNWSNSTSSIATILALPISIRPVLHPRIYITPHSTFSGKLSSLTNTLCDYNGETTPPNNLVSRAEEKTDGRRPERGSPGRNAEDRSSSQSPATAVHRRIQAAHPAGSRGLSRVGRNWGLVAPGRRIFIEPDQLASAAGTRRIGWTVSPQTRAEGGSAGSRTGPTEARE